MASTKTTTPTLNLSTISEGAPLTINGKAYQVRHPDSLVLMVYKRLEVQLPRLGHLLAKATPTDEELEEASDLLRKVVDVILDAPADVRGELKDVQRVLILNVFTQLRPETLATLTEGTTTARQRTGARSSRR